MHSSRGRHTGRRFLTAALAVLSAMIAVLAVRALALHGAHRLLRRWEQTVFAGAPIEGSGPGIALRWPPQAEWRDLRWRFPEGGAVTCDRLRVGLLPGPLLRGKVAVGAVDADTLRVVDRLDLDGWASRVCQAATDRAAAGRHERPDPQAVRLTIRSLVFPSSAAGPLSVQGWTWSEGVGRWTLLARARTGDGLSMTVNGHGIESPDRREGALGIALAPGRSVRLDWLGAGTGGASSQLTVEDDGRFLEAFLHTTPFMGGVSPRGRIALNLGRTAGHPPEGEVRLDGLELALVDGAALRIDGLVCLQGGRATLEEFRATSERTDIRVAGDLPLAAGLPAGRLTFEGVLDGDRFAADGAVRTEADSAVWTPTALRWGGAATGPSRLVWSRAPGSRAPGWTRLRGDVSLGGVTVRLEESGECPGGVVASGRGLSFESLGPWLPFDLAGEWSGSVDLDGLVKRSGGSWAAQGFTVVHDGRVSGLRLLDEIGSLVGGGGRGALRFREARTRWSYRSGRFFADSLFVEGGKLKIEGAVTYAEPDSLLGLLRITPAGGSGLSSLLRLLGGGEAALDLGIRGDPDRPEMIPLDPQSLGPWRDEVAGIRTKMARSQRP